MLYKIRKINLGNIYILRYGEKNHLLTIHLNSKTTRKSYQKHDSDGFFGIGILTMENNTLLFGEKICYTICNE